MSAPSPPDAGGTGGAVGGAPGKVVIGTRGSALARWQAAYVGRALAEAHPGLVIEEKIIVTEGDRVQTGPVIDLGGKGVWVKEIEEALLAGAIDVAVHSLKDVPSELAPGLTLVAIPRRADPRDAFVSRSGAGLAALPAGSRVGTSSLRRVCLVHAARADLSVEILRGNVDTRLRKVAEGVVDAAVLACAGLDRLGFADRITERLSIDQMLPAIGQGALALEARDGDARVAALCRALADPAAELTIAAERALLAGLGVGCRTPVAGHATLVAGPGKSAAGGPPRGDGDGDLADGQVLLRALVGRPDASEILREELAAPPHQAAELGAEVAKRLLRRGADRILRELEHAS